MNEIKKEDDDERKGKEKEDPVAKRSEVRSGLEAAIGR